GGGAAAAGAGGAPGAGGPTPGPGGGGWEKVRVLSEPISIPPRHDLRESVISAEAKPGAIWRSPRTGLPPSSQHVCFVPEADIADRQPPRLRETTLRGGLSWQGAAN